MNLFNKAFFAVLVVLSGSSIFAACCPCGVKRSTRATAVAMKQVSTKRARRAIRQARRVMRNTRTRRCATGACSIATKERSATLGAFVHGLKKDRCKDGVCSL